MYELQRTPLMEYMNQNIITVSMENMLIVLMINGPRELCGNIKQYVRRTKISIQ